MKITSERDITPGRTINVQLYEQGSTLIVLILRKAEGPHVTNIETRMGNFLKFETRCLRSEDVIQTITKRRRKLLREH